PCVTRDLHSVPTRRSSDLDQQLAVERGVEQHDMRHAEHNPPCQEFWRRCKLEMNLIGSHDQFADTFHQFLLSAEQDAEFVPCRRDRKSTRLNSSHGSISYA